MSVYFRKYFRSMDPYVSAWLSLDFSMDSSIQMFYFSEDM